MSAMLRLGGHLYGVQRAGLFVTKKIAVSRLTLPSRRFLSDGGDKAALRKKRLAARKQNAPAAPKPSASGGGASSSSKSAEEGMSGGFIAAMLGLASFVGAGVYLSQTKSWLSDWMNDVMEPYSDELLPKWESGAFYGEIPPGQPPLPLLVLDLEKTLITSTHDAKYGWRHVKRPGFDRFLEDASKYFEIVILSENSGWQEFAEGLDPKGMAHKFGPEAGEVRNNVVLKRLDIMGRPMDRIILIDDSAEASQLFPQNTLLIKPFDDINDTRDRELADLMTLLQAIIHDRVESFPACFKDLGTNDAREAITEYRMRVSEAKAAEFSKRNKGLGALLRGEADPGDEVDDVLAGESLMSKLQIGGSGKDGALNVKLLSKNLTGAGNVRSKADLSGVGAGDITGKGSGSKKPEKTVQKKKKGALFQWVEDKNAAEEERSNAKMEALNRKYAELQEQKQKEMEAEKRRKDILAGN